MDDNTVLISEESMAAVLREQEKRVQYLRAELRRATIRLAALKKAAALIREDFASGPERKNPAG